MRKAPVPTVNLWVHVSRAAYVHVAHAHALGNAQVLTAKASMSGGVLQYAPASQSLDGGAFSAFIMAAMLDSQVLSPPAL